MRMPFTFTFKLYHVGLALMAGGLATLAILAIVRPPAALGVVLIFSAAVLAILIGSGRTFSGSYWDHHHRQRLG